MQQAQSKKGASSVFCFMFATGKVRMLQHTTAVCLSAFPCGHGPTRHIRPVLPRVPRFFTVEATEKECAALAERFSCESITGLKADLRVVRAAGSDARKIKIKVLGGRLFSVGLGWRCWRFAERAMSPDLARAGRVLIRCRFLPRGFACTPLRAAWDAAVSRSSLDASNSSLISVSRAVAAILFTCRVHRFPRPRRESRQRRLIVRMVWPRATPVCTMLGRTRAWAYVLSSLLILWSRFVAISSSQKVPAGRARRCRSSGVTACSKLSLLVQPCPTSSRASILCLLRRATHVLLEQIVS